MQTPFPYQADGIDWLTPELWRPRKTALLADEPGLGKTLQAIRAADKAGFLKVLVVCPASLCENWRREIRAERQGDWSAFVVSYQMMTGKHFEKIMSERWCAVIFDEAHYLKSSGSKRTQAAFGYTSKYGGRKVFAPGVVSRADHVWLLTGTPMPNHAGELFPYLNAVAPSALVNPRSGHQWSYEQFVTKFCEIRQTTFGRQIVGTKNHEMLSERLAPVMLRRLKRDVMADMPPITWSEFYVEPKLSDDQLGITAEIAEAAMLVLSGANKRSRKLRGGQLAQLGTLRRVTAMAKAKAMREYLIDWLDSNEGKIVVFSAHVDVLEQLRRDRRIDSRAVKIDGSVKSDDRASYVDRFQNDPQYRIFLGQITAAGTGLTLTAASDLVFIDQSWVPAENAQAAMRIHRIGQQNACHIRTAMLSGSIDERVQRALLRKSWDIVKVMGD